MSQFFKTRKETESWLKRMDIEDFVIQDDLTVNVLGYVNLNERDMGNAFPVRFGRVGGYFSCIGCDIKTLIGAPHTVGESFYCDFNRLASLSGAPFSVGDDFVSDFSGANLRKHIRALFDEGRGFSAGNLTALCAEIRAEMAAEAMASAVSNAAEAPAIAKRKAVRA